MHKAPTNYNDIYFIEAIIDTLSSQFNIDNNKSIISKVGEIIGYNNSFGGTFPTGGSMSNFMSLIMARDEIPFFSNLNFTSLATRS